VNGPVTPVIDNAEFMAAALKVLPKGNWDTNTWKEWTTAVKDITGAKGKMLFMPLRQALTGLGHGPDMGSLLPLIGRARVEARLNGQNA
jgi:glutamyl-tRNA synthetase